MQTSTFLRSSLLAAAFGAALSASADQLVTNGGFESRLAGFSVGGATFISVDHPHSGTYLADFNPSGGGASLSQDLATVAGRTYRFSYFLNNVYTVNNDFTVAFGGQTVMSGAGPQTGAVGVYTAYSFDVTATSNVSTISFTIGNDLSSIGLDDVSVQTVPEPASMAALGLGALALLRRRKRA